MKTNLLFLSMFLVLLCVTGCHEEAEVFLPDQVSEEADQYDTYARTSQAETEVRTDELLTPEDVCGEILTYNLVAGKAFIGGMFSLANDADFLYVEFTSNDPWMIKEIHVFLGQEEDLLLSKKGNPKIGQFTGVSSYDPWISEAPLAFAIADLNISDGIISVIGHATLVQIIDELEVTKSVFAEWEYDFEGKRWGGFLDYYVQDCTGGEEQTTTDSEETEIQDEEEEMGIDFPACADPATKLLVIGQSNEAGSVEFFVDGEFLIVKYTLTIDEWLITEIHINVGDDIILTRTGNPKVGQFDYVAHLEALSDEFEFQLPIADIFPGEADYCNQFVVHATLEKTVDEITYSKSAFAEWEYEFDGSKKGGYFNLCLNDDCLSE